jgi:hypothetical protein
MNVVVNFSRANKELEWRENNKVEKEVNNTELKSSPKRKDWRRRRWEHVCRWWCIENGRCPLS